MDMKKSQPIHWLSWFFLLLNLLSAFLISKVEDYNLWFIALLLLNMLIGVVFAKRINKSVLLISRILVGLLFVYSGFVKGVDPLGTQFRIEDYFYAYGSVWAIPMALGLSVFMNASEFSLGAFFLTKIKTNWVSSLALLMMLFFTITTINDAVNNPVPDCGCFGDALIITNWQTLYKNLVIDALVLLLFLRRADMELHMPTSKQLVAATLIFAAFVGFETYNIKHLPLVDFRPWKVGNRLLPENPLPVKYFLTYKNTKTGEEKEYLSQELPWKDSTFMADWKWLSSREEDPNMEENRTFPMVDADGEDWSSDLVKSQEGILFISIYDIAKISDDEAQKMNRFITNAQKSGLEVVMLNSDTRQNYQDYKKKLGIPDLDVYNSDDTALKAAVRSNPGLIVVKNAQVLAKYHINDFPSIEEIKQVLK